MRRGSLSRSPAPCLRCQSTARPRRAAAARFHSMRTDPPTPSRGGSQRDSGLRRQGARALIAQGPRDLRPKRAGRSSRRGLSPARPGRRSRLPGVPTQFASITTSPQPSRTEGTSRQCARRHPLVQLLARHVAQELGALGQLCGELPLERDRARRSTAARRAARVGSGGTPRRRGRDACSPRAGRRTAASAPPPSRCRRLAGARRVRRGRRDTSWSPRRWRSSLRRVGHGHDRNVAV